jgi:hypothetical protein
MREIFWRMRPDGIVVLPPAGNKAGTLCILEHKRMSDCCEHYLVRAKKTAENQYASLRSAIITVIQWQGWKVDQVSFITGARSVDKQDFRNNLKFFGVPEASISSIYSKLAMRTFDVYANILKCMYSTRFNGLRLTTKGRWRRFSKPDVRGYVTVLKGAKKDANQNGFRMPVFNATYTGKGYNQRVEARSAEWDPKKEAEYDRNHQFVGSKHDSAGWG